MQLEYRLTEEDYIHFNNYHLKHSPQARRNTIIWYLSAPVIWAFVFFVSEPALGPAFGFAFVSLLVASGLWLCITPFLLRWHVSWYVRSRVKAFKREVGNTHIFGKQVVTVSSEGITATTETMNGEIKWKGISKVAAGEHGIYLYPHSLSALVVPNSAFDAVNTRERFLEEVLRYREQAAGLIETV